MDNNYNNELNNNMVPNNGPINNLNQPVNNTQNVYNTNPVNNQTGIEPNNQNINIIPPQENIPNVSVEPPMGDDPKKKNNKLLIIIIVLLLLIALGVALYFVLGNKGKESSDSTTHSGTSKGDISQLSVDYDGIVALTADGKLYGIGKKSYVFESDNITLLADNVKYLDNESFDGSHYIGNNNTLYTRGAYYKGGVKKEYTELYNNAISYDYYSSFCEGVITTDGDAYIANGFTVKYCGLSKSTDGFKKIGSNAKKVILGYNYNGYITNNGELFMSSSEEDEYHKVLDNVNDIVRSNIFSSYILTNDNKLYEVKVTNGVDILDKFKIELLDDNVKKITNIYYQKVDGKYYIYFSDRYYYMPYYKGNNSAINNTNVVDDMYPFSKADFYQIDFDETVKDIYDVSYINNATVYLNGNNKIVAYVKDKGKKVFDNKISSLNSLYEFIKKES